MDAGIDDVERRQAPSFDLDTQIPLPMVFLQDKWSDMLQDWKEEFEVKCLLHVEDWSRRPTYS